MVFLQGANILLTDKGDVKLGELPVSFMFALRVITSHSAKKQNPNPLSLHSSRLRSCSQNNGYYCEKKVFYRDAVLVSGAVFIKLAALWKKRFFFISLSRVVSKCSSVQDGSRSGSGGEERRLQPALRHLGCGNHVYRAGRAAASHV